MATRTAGNEGQLHVNLVETSFYLGRETLIATRRTAALPDSDGGTRPGLSYWRKRLFIVMTRNARSATAFFGLPPNRVVELGAQIQF